MRQKRPNTFNSDEDHRPGAPLKPQPAHGQRGEHVLGQVGEASILSLFTCFCSIAFLIYGSHLREGLLADDYLYTTWLGQGFSELLQRLTITSDPRMIRPVAAFGWWLGSFAGGVWIQHTLSILLHSLCALFVARLAEQGRAGAGLLAGLLFVTFPLFAEPVIWLSSAFDLWATFFALAALLAGLSSNLRWRRPLAILLFTLSLLSKESTLLLPLLLFCLPNSAPFDTRRRLAIDFALVAAAYFLLRLTLFGGPGGYLDPQGHSLAWRLEPLRFLRNALLQVPYRLLIPLKRAGDLAPFLALTSSALGGLILTTAQPWQNLRGSLLAVGAFLLALAPTAPVFGIDVDHENSRMLYFPVAILCVAATSACRPSPPRLRSAVGALALFWGVVSIANGISWSQANREVQGTLEDLREIQHTFPPGATVFIAGHDTWRGAYAWRNALYPAIHQAGLRQDLDWRLGSAALVDTPELLGTRVFELEVHPLAPMQNFTLCQRALFLQSPPHLTSLPLKPLHLQRDALGLGGRLDLPPLALPTAAAAPAVKITVRSPLTKPLLGRLFWRLPGIDRFNVTDARRFRIFPSEQPHTIVRLPASPAALEQLELRLETERVEAIDQLAEVQILDGGGACLPKSP